MAKYLLQDAGINWLAIMALLTFVIVFCLALVLVFGRKADSFSEVERQPLDDAKVPTEEIPRS